MHLETHMLTSLEHFGKEFRHVHGFLDQYFRAFHMAHRIIFHHKRGLGIIEEKFGQEARKAAEVHVREDTGGDLPDDWNFYYDGQVVLLNLDNPGIEAIMEKLYPDYEPPY